MNVLSINTERLIIQLYVKSDPKRIKDILIKECDSKSLGCDDWSVLQMERIWFSILKIGLKGNSEFESAIVLAKTDWRDLLMSAGFGEDLKAHLKWSRMYLKPKWMFWCK